MLDFITDGFALILMSGILASPVKIRLDSDRHTYAFYDLCFLSLGRRTPQEGHLHPRILDLGE